jgi:hypothetical protein
MDGADLLAMSDEDIMNMQSPPEDGEIVEPVDKTAVEDVVTPVEEVAETPTAQIEAATPVAEPKKEGIDSSSVGSKPEEKPAEQPAAVDYEAFYKQVMTPFQANGKTIELRDINEAVQLMQKGANYTRKMQDIAPHRKVLMMLENNGLLDEGKLSYLIDLEKKNPEAIKKLIKDAGIDPMDIDTTVEPTYREGNHKVTDEEASFRNVLDDLSSNPEGKATLNTVHNTWDQASKEILWKNPEYLTLIHQQREGGIYDRIATEVERQRILGTIAPNTPFLHAYKAVGDKMVEANAFADLVPKTNPTPVITRAAVPKPQVANGDKANAAAPTRSTPRKAEAFVNPLSMSDDEFLKHMNNRV